jgi:hypothetical protein
MGESPQPVLIKDAIGSAIASLLQALVISSENPNGSLSLVQRPTSAGMPASPQNQSCYILQGDLRPPEDDGMESEGQNIVVTAIQPFELNLFAIQSDSATTPVDSVLNAMEAAVVGAILDGDGGSYLCVPVPALANVLGAVWFDPSPMYFRDPRNAAIFGQTKRLLVEFRHVQNNLFIPTTGAQ